MKSLNFVSFLPQLFRRIHHIDCQRKSLTVSLYSWILLNLYAINIIYACVILVSKNQFVYFSLLPSFHCLSYLCSLFSLSVVFIDVFGFCKEKFEKFTSANEWIFNVKLQNCGIIRSNNNVFVRQGN